MTTKNLRRRPNWKEWLFLTACFSVLTFWGAKLYFSQWPLVSVGPLSPTIERIQFECLTENLSPDILKRLQKIQRTTPHKVVVVEATTHIGHQGFRPGWWGQIERAPAANISSVNEKGNAHRNHSEAVNVVFDDITQHYVVTRRYYIYASETFIKRNLLIITAAAYTPPKPSDLNDMDAPIVIKGEVARQRIQRPLPGCLTE